VRSRIILVTFVLAVAASGAAGCAHVDIAAHINKQSPVPVTVPRIMIDEPASLTAFKYLSAADAPRTEVIRGMDQFWNKGSVPVDGQTLPARVIVESRSTGPRSMNSLVSNELIALFTAGALFLFGVPTAWDTQMVTVTIEIDGREYRATGQGKCFAGLYYPSDPGPCALSKGLTEALRLISVEVSAVYAGRIQPVPTFDPAAGSTGGLLVRPLDGAAVEGWQR